MENSAINNYFKSVLDCYVKHFGDSYFECLSDAEKIVSKYFEVPAQSGGSQIHSYYNDLIHRNAIVQIIPSLIADDLTNLFDSEHDLSQSYLSFDDSVVRKRAREYFRFTQFRDDVMDYHSQAHSEKYFGFLIGKSNDLSSKLSSKRDLLAELAHFKINTDKKFYAQDYIDYFVNLAYSSVIKNVGEIISQQNQFNLESKISVN